MKKNFWAVSVIALLSFFLLLGCEKSEDPTNPAGDDTTIPTNADSLTLKVIIRVPGHTVLVNTLLGICDTAFHENGGILGEEEGSYSPYFEGADTVFTLRFPEKRFLGTECRLIASLEGWCYGEPASFVYIGPGNGVRITLKKGENIAVIEYTVKGLG